jgi:hypothetical protein
MSNVRSHFKGKGAMAPMILIDRLPHPERSFVTPG